MGDTNTQKKSQPNMELLNKMGKVVPHEPTPLIPYNPARPDGEFNIVRSANKPVEYAFGFGPEE